ncbi:MAG: S1C family serine protease [Bacteroidia bacterium]|nr:S1C family serine protease [Bacteroidia bacterium]
MKKLLLVFIIAVLSSGCASILNAPYQKVAISTPENTEILINGEEATLKQGKYLMKRDFKPKQITINREGYKSENVTVIQYKRSPLYILSWVPFGILVYPPFYDIGPKSYNYDKEIATNKDMVSLPLKGEKTKEIMLNKIGINLTSENIKYRYFGTYSQYLRRGTTKSVRTDDSNEDVELQNTIFTDALNEILKENGYIDTTKTVLKNSYLNNLLINATITDYTFNNITNKIVFVDLTINWEVLDYYKNSVYTYTSYSHSGQFGIHDYDKKDETIYQAIKDAIEYGLIEFMNTEKTLELLHDYSELETESSFEEIVIPSSETYVSDLNQAIKSSVTVKNKNGHGSGFIVSPNGYIITNYHVVAEKEGLKIRMNDKTEHDATIVRISKLRDLALLKIEVNGLIPFDISPSEEVEIASDVYVVGTPNAEDLSQTVSRGIISGVRETSDGLKLIQTDASINPGNSGGAMANKQGLVLGVISAKLMGGNIEGVGFGIPSSEIFKTLKIVRK